MTATAASAARVLAVAWSCALLSSVAAEVPNSTTAPATTATAAPGMACPARLAAIDASGVRVVSLPAGRIAVVGPAREAARNALRQARAEPLDALLLSPDAPPSDAFGALPTPVLRPRTERVASSALVGDRGLDFAIARVGWGASALALLVYRPSGQPSIPLALLDSTATGSSTSVTIDLLPRAAPLPAAVDVALLEHLYSLSLRYPAQGAFFLSIGCDDCGPTRGVSQAAVLQRLAALRACIGNRQVRDGGPALVPWRVPALTTTSAEPGRVAIRVSDEGVPVAGRRIIFGQGLSAGCSAVSDAGGVAACTLVDEDPDDDDAGSERAPVIATFPGEVGDDLIRPPTAAVIDPPS